MTGLQWRPRAGHSATLVDGNQLLVAGGVVDDAIVGNVELIDLQTWTATSFGTLDSPRAYHAARLLGNGATALWGGEGLNGPLTSSGAIIDPTTRTTHDIAVPEEDDLFPWLAASNPEHGATDVGLQPRVTLRFTRPARMETVNIQTVTLSGPAGTVAVDVVPAESGRLAFVRPRTALEPNTTYMVTVDGAQDWQDAVFPLLSVAFTTTAPPQTDSDVDDELWDPSATDEWARWRTNRPRSRWEGQPPLKAAPGVTALSGQVLRLNGRPLAGVTLRLEGRSAVTDSTGRFLLVHENLASGSHELWMDGRTANRKGATYGTFEAAVRVNAGDTSVLPFTIWMPKIDTANAVTIPSPTTGDIAVTTPRIPGLELRLPPGTVISDEDGRIVREVSITPIPVDRPPFPLPASVDVPIYFTIQPGGAYVAVTSQSSDRRGARLIYPNYRGQPAGAPMEFWHYSPREGRGWYVYGRGAVTSNGQQVVPDLGVSLYEFTGAMVAPPGLGGGPGPQPGDPGYGGDPVHLGTGQFVMNDTDLMLADVQPIAINRTYRTNDVVSRSFGLGATHQFDMFLVGTTFPYTYMDLVLPDGGRVHYDRISAGTGYADAVYEHTSSPTGYFKSRISWNGGGWNLDLKDGSRITFRDGFGATRPAQAAATTIQDRHGNVIVFTRDSSANLTRITSPNGHWIELTYDASYRVTEARDHINRVVQYTYDTSGRLWRVTDVLGGVTEYTYDASHRMLTIKDARAIVYLTNEYNAAGRVITQTQADNSVFQFAYTLDGSGRVTQTDVTDPRGYVHRTTYSTAGYLVTDTYALGQPEARTYSYERQAGTNLLLATVDALSRRTEYSYDTFGNVTSITQLAGTASAVTASYTYESTFQQLASVTDPLNHTTTFTHDAGGNVTAITDPLNHQSTITYNSAGQPLTVTTPAGTTQQFAYDGGDLVTVTDPVGGTTTRFIDAVGRLARATNPLGQATRYEYDGRNRITKTIDALGGETALTYDANGNLLTLTDARNQTTTYAYNTMDRAVTRTDPLDRVESYVYDANGNLQQMTDRKNQVTTYTRDPLNRVRTITYADSSTTTNTYDAGDRLMQVVDSVAGTITRTYDLLDRLTQETTPEGVVSYTHDAVGRRTTMTVAGQAGINYSYDPANRVTAITQASANVGFTYDAADRRTTLTLPNGVTVGYGYDAASQVTSVTYRLDETTLGDLTYTYDLAGNRVAVGGSWARTGLPAPLASATYDAANQVATWGSTSLTYDANGNLTNDGTRTYTWNARNQLTGLSGSVSASFQYDGFGRRWSRTVNSTNRSFLYDGLNLMQELSGGSSVANLLNGLAIDETFTRTDAGGARSLLLDALGNTLALADGSGTVQTSYTYEPFGITAQSGSASGNVAQFTGRENDGTGLYYYRARYYHPYLQRFSSEDPLGFAGGLHHYAYAESRPTLFTDPLGLKPRPGFGQPPGGRPGGPGDDGPGAGPADDSRPDDPPPPHCRPGTLQLGVSGALTGNGLSVSGFGGVVVDANGGIGLYGGGGLGLGVGAGGSMGGQLGFSNGRSIHDMGGPFVDIGAGGGAGAIGGVDYFSGIGLDGQTVTGGSATAGVGLRGSASSQTTYTKVIPLNEPSACR